MKFKMRNLLISSLILSGNLFASSVLGFGADADYYAVKAEGNFEYQGNVTQFDGGRNSSYQIGLYFEHPIPLMPNFRVDLTPETSFSGTGSGPVRFKQMDITPYYELVDIIVDLDVGVTLKFLDGSLINTANTQFNEIIPMGYVAFKTGIPLTDLLLDGQWKYIWYAGDSISDAKIKINWNLSSGFGAQVGYRYEKLNLENRFDMTTNMTFSGPFVGLNYNF